MKKALLLTVASLLTFFSNGQNLVSNPGFENYLTCPSFGQFSNIYIEDWTKPSVGSSDYYHYNCPGITPQQQAPRTGEAYAGIIGYNFGTEYREYITGTLITPLIAGSVYNVDFYVSLNDGYIQAIEELGAYLSVAAPGPFSNALHLNVVPQVEHTNGTITDTAGWKHVYGQFTASGGEQFITIGNFHDDAGTTITQPGTTGSFGAYYFVDDVSVTLADSTSGFSESSTTPFSVYIIDKKLQIKLLSGMSGSISVTDMSGRFIFNAIDASGTITVQLSGTPGLFLVTVEHRGKLYNRKISSAGIR